LPQPVLSLQPVSVIEVLLLWSYTSGAGPGPWVPGLHGPTRIRKEARLNHHEKETRHTGSPQTTHEGDWTVSLVDLLTSACFVGESVLLQTWQDLSHWIMSKIS